MANKPRLHTSWLRFRMHTLFVAVTVACVWLGTHVNHVRQQKDAVAAITEAGGHVRYDHQPDLFTQGRRAISAAGVIQPVYEPAGPRWLRRMIGDDYFQDVVEVMFVRGDRVETVVQSIASLSHLEILHLRNATLSDTGVRHLAALNNLKTLELSGTNISDDGLVHLRRLTHLESLKLDNVTTITDSGISNLANLKALKSLSLEDAVISDGLKYLRELPSLQTLNLQFSHVDDDGLEHLVGLASLRKLNIEGTYVTEPAVNRFILAMPLCAVAY